MLKHCLDKYKTREICDKAFNSYLLTLKFVLDRFATNKMLEKLDNSVFSYGDIFFNDADFNIVTFHSDDMGFNSIDLNNINLNDDDCDEEDPKTINHVRIMAWYNRFK